MKFLPGLLLFAFTPLLPAQELKTGEPLTASDLAKQLNVQNWTLVYKPGKEFSNVRFALIYRSRETRDAEFTEKSLINSTQSLRTPTKELPFTICLDANRATIITPGTSTAGDGAHIPLPATSSLPPSKGPSGRYLLLTSSFPRESSSEEWATKATLELEISVE